MTSTHGWARNTSGLQASAKQRAAATRKRVEAAIDQLLREPTQPITFTAVAAMTGVTKTYLYKQPRLREQIDLLRQERHHAQRLAPPAERTDGSLRILLVAKDRRIRDLQREVERLQAELALCRGALYDRLTLSQPQSRRSEPC